MLLYAAAVVSVVVTWDSGMMLSYFLNLNTLVVFSLISCFPYFLLNGNVQPQPASRYLVSSDLAVFIDFQFEFQFYRLCECLHKRSDLLIVLCLTKPQGD